MQMQALQTKTSVSFYIRAIEGGEVGGSSPPIRKYVPQLVEGPKGEVTGSSPVKRAIVCSSVGRAPPPVALIMKIILDWETQRIDTEKVREILEKDRLLKVPKQFRYKKDVHEEIKTINKKIEVLVEHRREWDEKYGQENVFIEIDIEDLVAEKNRLKNMVKFNTQEKMDIATAKLVPITDFMQFNEYGFARCPFHNEKSPSFRYYPENNRAYCFAGCGNKDVIDIVQAIHNINLPKALKLLLT